MNNQKGFIQISLLVVIIVIVLVAGGTGYFGIKQYQSYQVEKIEQAKIAQEKERVIKEKEKEAQMSIEAQQKALEEAQSEIEKLKVNSAEVQKKQEILEQRVKSEQQKQAVLEQKVIQSEKTQTKSFSISVPELNTYLSGTVEIQCDNSKGSGILWNLSGVGKVVVTNAHVVKTPIYNKVQDKFYCIVSAHNLDGEWEGVFQIYPLEKWAWNSVTDIAIMKAEYINIGDEIMSKFKTIDQLNYKISNLRKCSVRMSVGSPVALVGYPAFGEKSVTYGGTTGTQYFRIATDGIVSAHDTSVKYFQGLPYYNYFVSAKIDSGNSGGIALSKDGDGLCVLGIPTWVTLGNYETQGIVQNIHNVMYQ